MRANINDVELCLDTFGDPGDPAILLIHGAAASMDRWESPFCERLAAAGRYVIRYDHRDTGGSTTYPPGEPGYTGDDLLADLLGILDHLGVERAHLVGISMGGALAQQLAVDHPERMLSLTLMSTSPAAPGGPELPGMSDALRACSRRGAAARARLGRPRGGGRVPARRRAALRRHPRVRRGATRELIGRVYDRSRSMPSANNHFMLEGTAMAPGSLAEIAVPCS